MDVWAHRQIGHSALAPGTRFGEMEIVRVLAVGGFGIVYVARDHSLDRDVAVKEFMPAQLAGRSRGQRVSVRSISCAKTYALGLQSFVTEAKLLAQFTHPAMVKVYRFWEANGTGYMVMPYLRGPTLSDVRRSMSEPPTEVWLRAMIDPLLDALAMLHAQGCYHRDIAPDNVLVCDGGAPILLDFGAARRFIGNATQSLTAILKPCYAPIEQYAEATRLRQGPWTDLYALAALVTYLLDGRPPPASTARCIHDDMEPLALRHIPGVSTTFLSAIDWALAVRPRDRPQNAAQLRDALNGRLAPPPPPQRVLEPAAHGGADAAPLVVADLPFPATLRLDPPAPLRAPALAPAWLAKRLSSVRPWRIAAASVCVAAAVAWPFTRHPLPDMVVARSEAGAKQSTVSTVEAPLAATPSQIAADVLPAATLRVAAASDAGDAVQAAALPATLPVPRRLPVASVPTRPHPGAKPQKRAAKKAAPDRKLAGIPAAPPGPLQLCAERNFFVRPFCIQHRCDEPRFKAHPQCVPLRQTARYRND